MSRRKKQPRGRRRSAKVSEKLASAWERYWFGPVASIRPYLLTKAVLLLLAFDVWMLRVKKGGQYGLHGFNVAHFQWLDALQPLPSPELYVGLVLSVGFLALVCALAGAGRWALVLLAVAYTYSWAMSMIDSFQHHYFLSLVLTTFIFFPRLSAHDLYPTDRATERRTQAEFDSAQGNKRISSWAYVLLGVNIAVVYAFTALTKAGEAGFLKGKHIQRLVNTDYLGLIEAWATRLGLPLEVFWASLAFGVIAAEVFLFVAYFLAVRADENRIRGLRLVAYLGLITALSFHLANEFILALRIGWFSHYMLVIACIYFLPESFLWKVGMLLTWPTRRLVWIPSSLSAYLNRQSRGLSTVSTLTGASATAVIVGIVGYRLDLPGSALVGLSAGSILVSSTLPAVWLGHLRDAVRYLFATGLAAVVMWITITQTTVRFDYYDRFGFYQRTQGNLAAAIEAYEKALSYAPGSKKGPPYRRPF